MKHSPLWLSYDGAGVELENIIGQLEARVTPESIIVLELNL